MVDIGKIWADNAQENKKSTLFMRPGSEIILPIYSPEHGDNPRYPNLEKIPRITGSGCISREGSTGTFSTILEQR